MKCPFCDVEMLHGYLNCGLTIWSERKHKISILPDGEERYALHLGAPHVRLKKKCGRNCRVIM